MSAALSLARAQALWPSVHFNFAIHCQAPLEITGLGFFAQAPQSGEWRDARII